MEFEHSSLYREVSAILNSSTKPVHFTWKADVHVGDETYGVLKVLSVDLVQDYENDFGDTIVLTASIPAGTYAKRIYPHQSNMDITLYRIPIGETSDTPNPEATPQSERYTATLIDKGNPLLEGNAPGMLSEETLNLTSIVEVQFQLVNKALEQLRMITVGGIFRGNTNEEVIKCLLTGESQALKVEGARLPQGVDMVPASNQQKRDHVIIPQGTRLVDLPMYLHKNCGGVYNAGMGYYLQGDFWYVYPCYDVTRFNKSQRKLTVINVPPNKLPYVERTFRQDGNNLVVLATGEVRFRDDTDSRQLNEGNAIRFADANKIMDGFGDTKNNKTVLSRGANASEFMSTPRPNGNNNARLAPEQISANPFVQYSLLARRQGSLLSFAWENSRPEAIFPGMVTRVLYLQEGELRELDGVVLKVHHYAALRGNGLTATRYQTVSAISVFVKPLDAPH